MTVVHSFLKTSIREPFDDKYEIGVFAMGCFWGAERFFWNLPGVYSTQVGYTGGTLEYPTYNQVCTETTGHCEVVKVVYDPEVTSYDIMLKTFWENHDPTQLNRQGVDTGTRYRSCIFVANSMQKTQAINSKQIYQQQLQEQHLGDIHTTIEPTTTFYYAEDYHQQYLHKNPNGFCGEGGT